MCRAASIVHCVLMFALCGTAIAVGADSQEEAKKSPLELAIQEYKEQLPPEIRKTYGGLLTEENVRHAVLIAIERYEFHLKHFAEPGDVENFSTIRPAYARIGSHGEWPENASFWGWTSDHYGASSEGIHLRIKLDTPEQRSPSFVLPVLDLSWGKIGK